MLAFIDLLAGERERDPPPSDSLPKWMQWIGPSQTRATSFIWVCYVGSMRPNTWILFYCFFQTINRVGLKVEKLGFKLAPLWNAGIAAGGFTHKVLCQCLYFFLVSWIVLGIYFFLVIYFLANICSWSALWLVLFLGIC